MNILKIAAIGGALGLLSACATPFTADVSRFQNLPAPSGQTFAIVAADEDKAGGLEFGTYARYVAGELIQEGFTEVASPDSADMVVALDYGVGDPREKVRTRPGTRFGAFGFGGYPYGGFYGWRRSVFYDPWFYGPGFGWGGGFGGWNNEVYSVTVYNAYLDLEIRRRGGEPLFEGRAMTTVRNNDLPELVPNLVTAMFTDFPGNNGRTLRVKVPQGE
ncbi:MAG: DUF4136 domain-containing protein [Pacificimonas sp.]|jgi:hypothetical protein|nr:DUF4136 domain-containing protein [Pacificimonas sp.]